MSFLDKLIHKQQPSAEEQREMRVSEMARAEISVNVQLLQYLATSGKFDHDKMATYISMGEQFGKSITPGEKNNMLDAGTLLMPKLQNDGTTIDGFEQLRKEVMGVHIEAIVGFCKLISELSPKSENAATILAAKTVLEELNI